MAHQSVPLEMFFESFPGGPPMPTATIDTANMVLRRAELRMINSGSGRNCVQKTVVVPMSLADLGKSVSSWIRPTEPKASCRLVVTAIATLKSEEETPSPPSVRVLVIGAQV